jgi:hypothetical protein
VDYKKAFGKLHEGMIEISVYQTFSFVYIHTGNTIKDTAGCPLCGFGFQFVDGDYQVSQSVAAYKMIYPKLVALAKNLPTKLPLKIIFNFKKSKKWKTSTSSHTFWNTNHLVTLGCGLFYQAITH